MSNASSKRPRGAKIGVNKRLPDLPHRLRRAAFKGKVVFKRKSKQQLVAQPPAPAPTMATELQVAQRMMGEFMASTVMSRVQSDIGQLVRDFGDFKDNVGKLNSALGEFREQAINPVKRELEYLRFNMGARTEDNIGAMSKLVHHLESQIELLLKSRGVNPHQVDGAGETPLDKMGLPPNRPDYQTLEREGVQLVESGNAAADQVTMLNGSIDKLRDRLERIKGIAREAWGTSGEGRALHEIVSIASGDA